MVLLKDAGHECQKQPSTMLQLRRINHEGHVRDLRRTRAAGPQHFAL